MTVLKFQSATAICFSKNRLLVLSNDLKPQTIGAISDLQNAEINSVMITGDNLLTAISVGKKCGIINDKMTVISQGDNFLEIISN